MLLLILSSGAVLRFYNLGALNIWFDEAFSIYAVESHFAFDLLHGLNPPLYYFLLKIWIFVLGSQELIMRAFSIVCGLFSIWLTYKIAVGVFNKQVGLISAFLLALSPMGIYYSREIRSYGLLVVFSLSSVFFLIKVFRRGSVRDWVLYGIITLAVVYTHFAGLLLLLTQNLFVFIFLRKDNFKYWILIQLLLIGVLLPILVKLTSIMLSGQMKYFTFWISKASAFSVIQTFNIFNIGYNASRGQYVFSAILILPLFLRGIALLLKEKKECYYIVLFWSFYPIIILAILSNTIISVYVFRNLIFVLPAYYIVIAFSLSCVFI